jgi:hypothetical protein
MRDSRDQLLLNIIVAYSQLKPGKHRKTMSILLTSAFFAFSAFSAFSAVYYFYTLVKGYLLIHFRTPLLEQKHI